MNAALAISTASFFVCFACLFALGIGEREDWFFIPATLGCFLIAAAVIAVWIAKS